MQQSYIDSTKPAEPTFCRAPEMAAAIPMKIRTFHLYVKQGRLPSYKFGRQRLFKKAEVFAAIERHRRAAIDEILA